jgi:hypothetical protein
VEEEQGTDVVAVPSGSAARQNVMRILPARTTPTSFGTMCRSISIFISLPQANTRVILRLTGGRIRQ